MSDTNEPDAYGLLDEGEVHYATPFRDEAERVLRHTEDKDSVIVPLYRSPTLTDDEREAIETAAWACGNCDGFGGVPTRPAVYKGNEIAATLRQLLERLHT